MRSWSKIRTNVRAIGEITRRILGAPDYERYLAHIRQHHPAARPLTRDQFARQCLEERYSKPGSRCC